MDSTKSQTKTAAKEKPANDEGRIFTHLKSQLDELDHSCAELTLWVEKTSAGLERGVNRLDDLEQAKSAAQSANRKALDNAETAAAKDAQESIRSANSVIGSVLDELRKTVKSLGEFEHQNENLRRKLLPLPALSDELERAVRDLGNQARRLLDGRTRTTLKIGRIKDIAHKVKWEK